MKMSKGAFLVFVQVCFLIVLIINRPQSYHYTSGIPDYEVDLYGTKGWFGLKDTARIVLRPRDVTSTPLGTVMASFEGQHMIFISVSRPNLVTSPDFNDLRIKMANVLVREGWEKAHP